MDALSKLALHKACAASADIEAQLSVQSGQRPVLVMLQMAKEEAAVSIAKLVDVDPEDPKVIRELQNEVHRYLDLCRWLGNVVSAGKEAESLITNDDREEMIEVLSGTSEGQLELINLGLLEGDTPNAAAH